MYSPENHASRKESTPPRSREQPLNESIPTHLEHNKALDPRAYNSCDTELGPSHLDFHHIYPGFHQVLRIPDLIEVLRPVGAKLTFNDRGVRDALQDELDFFSPSLFVQGSFHDNPESKIYSALTKEMNRLNKNECRQLAHYLTSLVELQTIHAESSEYTLTLRTTPPSQAEVGFPGFGFHLDVRSKRLLSTLVGPGMEWVLPEEVNPEQLALIMKGKESSHLFRDDAVVKQTHTGDVVLFTGNRLPHRPPITTERRLICVIDSP